MKKRIFAALSAALLTVVSCYNDDDLYNKYNDLSSRVSTLEEQVEELNNKTIPGIQAIVASLSGNVYVTSVSKNADGSYTIVFSNKTTATIANGVDGAKGDKGDTPVISVKEVNGVFYWTADGELLKDASGNPVEVYLAQPQLRIKDGKWQVSYDKGTTWADVPTMGNASTGSAISIQDSDTAVTFYIDGTAYVIQKEVPFYLVFEQRKDIGVPQGSTYEFPYTLQGVNKGDVIDVDVLSVTDGWTAEVKPTNDSTGVVAVTNVSNVSGKVFIYAANGKGKTDIKSLCFEGGVLSAVSDVEGVLGAGSTFAVAVTTNMEYEVKIDSSWVKQIVTKAAHTDSLKFEVEANTNSTFRSASIVIANKVSQEGVDTIVVLQYPSASITTDIASASALADGTVCTIYNESVLASSTTAAYVSDGTSLLLTTGKELPVGKSVNVTGIKKTNGSKAYIEVLSSEVTSETAPVTDLTSVFYSYATTKSPMHTYATGVLSKVGDKYSIHSFRGMIIAIEDPTESLAIEKCDTGKFYTLSAYTLSPASDTTTVIAKSLTPLTFSENNNWSLSYSLDESNSTAPDVITNTVTGTTSNYRFSCFGSSTLSKYENVDALAQYAALYYADDLQYRLTLYSSAYSYDYIYGVYAKTGTTSVNFNKLAYGDYVAFATGVDEYGNPTGEYKAFQFTKEDPAKKAAYSEFIGNWSTELGTVTVAQDVADSSYTISGLFTLSDTKYGTSTLTAKYDAENGKMIIPEQCLGTWTNNGSEANTYFCGMFTSNSKSYPHYTGSGSNSSTPYNLISASIYKTDNNLHFDAGTSKYLTAFTGWTIRWSYTAKPTTGNYLQQPTSLPMTFTKEEAASADYSKWLGTWTVKFADSDTTTVTKSVTITKLSNNQTVTLSGLGVDMPLAFDASTGNLAIKHYNFKSNATYYYHVAVLNASRSINYADDLGKIAMNNDGTATATVTLDGYDRWGVIGYKISTSKWVTFTDVQYVFSPATFTKVSGSAVKTAASKSFDIVGTATNAAFKASPAKFGSYTLDPLK